jgi:putative hydrolase of the HAD superfamily
MQSRVHNVVFDFGAVLFTWQPGLLIKTHFPEHAATPEKTLALAQAVFGHADWHNFDRGVLSPETVSQRTAGRLGLHEPALLALVEGIAEHLRPMPDSLALLKEVRELRQHEPALRLYFLSNMPTPYARVLERKHAILDWFDGGIFSGDVQHIKPEAEIYELLENRYALEPAHTLFIDDLATNVACAEARGWRGIRFESAAQLRAELLVLLPGIRRCPELSV